MGRIAANAGVRRVSGKCSPTERAPAMVAASGCAPPMPPTPPDTSIFPRRLPPKCCRAGPAGPVPPPQ